MKRLTLALCLMIAPVMPPVTAAEAAAVVSEPDAKLLKLFEDWRSFERPAVSRSVPDYGAAAMARKAQGLQAMRQRLAAIDTRGWPAKQLSDYKLIQAEMNGLDFDLRILKPWARDPAFYATFFPNQTDVPAQDAPTAYPSLNLYTYKFPLSAADQRQVMEQLRAIRPLLAQARANLQGSNARDLWVYGTQRLREQVDALRRFEEGSLNVSSVFHRGQATIPSAAQELRSATRETREATEAFVAWLEAEAPRKTGPSGVGKENYTWYIQNVHLLPYSWEDEVTLMERELERARAALQLEEHRNRNLPLLEPVADAAAYDRMAKERLDQFISFLVDGEIIPDKPYIRRALSFHKGRFLAQSDRTFFAHVTHRDPRPLYSHDYHWLELARVELEPHSNPIRRAAPLYNIYDTRAEGFATAFEEIIMHAGLYDDSPRSRELVWIMLANRAARGLASLYVHANEYGLEEAGRFHAAWTPRGWAGSNDELTTFEQLLYLRQPGYGTSYISGKLMFDRLLSRVARKREQEKQPFVLRDVIGSMNESGFIPLALLEDELTAR